MAELFRAAWMKCCEAERKQWRGFGSCSSCVAGTETSSSQSCRGQRLWNSPKGIQAALIAYLLLPWDVIQLQASLDSLPAALLCFGFFCNTPRKDGVEPLYLWLCNSPCRHTQTYKHTCLLNTSTNMHACTYSRAHRHCIKVFARTDQRTLNHMGPHTRTHAHQTRLRCHQRKRHCSSAGRLAFRKGSELTANYSRWPTEAGDRSQMHSMFTHTPAPPWMGEMAAQPRAHSHFVTPQGTFPPLPVWGIDEVVPLSEFAVISPGT